MEQMYKLCRRCNSRMQFLWLRWVCVHCERNEQPDSAKDG